jgi:acetyltransferase
MVKYHQSLSDQSVYLRYMHPMQLIDRVSHERLGRICHSDYDRQITLVAEDNDPETNEPRIIGASRLSKLHSQNGASYTVMISDCCQGKGLGTVLLSKLIEIGRAEKLEWIEAYITSDNLAMQAVSKKLGFTISPTDSEHLVRAELIL